MSRQRVLITGGDPDARYLVPEEDLFDAERAGGFLVAPDLEAIGRALAGRYIAFGHLRDMVVTYLWREKGGKSHGRETLGACQKPTGLLRHFSGSDFVIWLAADHLREREAKAYEVEAIVFHELLHTGSNDDGDPVLIGHEWEGFGAEIEQYGVVATGASYLASAMQPFLFEAEPS